MMKVYLGVYLSHGPRQLLWAAHGQDVDVPSMQFALSDRLELAAELSSECCEDVAETLITVYGDLGAYMVPVDDKPDMPEHIWKLLNLRG